MIGGGLSYKCEICHWRASSPLFIPKGCNVLALMISRAIPRHATLQPQEQKTTKTDRTPFVISFNPALPNISCVVKKHITILQSSTNCKKAFPCPPVIAYNSNVKQVCVMSYLKTSLRINNWALEFINATTHDASPVHFS